MTIDHSFFQSPFSWRYASPEMCALWSEVNKRRLWRRIWVALAEAQSRFGLTTPEQVADLQAHVEQVDLERGKVGEYESLDSGMEGGFTLHSYSKRNFLDLEGAIQDENDQNYLIDFEASRIFETETT